MRKHTFTLAADYFHSHAGMLMPVHGLKADESSDDWFVKVTVFHWIGIRISFKHLIKELKFFSWQNFDATLKSGDARNFMEKTRIEFKGFLV